MFQARRAKQVTTWRSTALLRAICLRGRTAERLAFHRLIFTIEKVQKLPLPQSFQGQGALLQETKMWLVGKRFIKFKDVHTCFPLVKKAQIGFFEACGNEKQPDFCLQIMITKHGVCFKIWYLLTAVMFSCVAKDFSSKKYNLNCVH